MPTITTAPLMTVKDLADYLNKPVSWIYDHRDALPVIQLGNHLRFRQADIDAWLDSQKVGL